MEKKSISDMEDVSRLLAALILTGNIEASVRRLYESISETERETNVRKVLEGLYSLLPLQIATIILNKQDEITGRVTVMRRKPILSSGRTFTLFGGIKKIAIAVFVFWFLIVGTACLAVRHHHLQKLTYAEASSPLSGK
jgi:hypothetical protein